MGRLLTQALRAGVPVLEFWQMTPRETVQVIEAAVWRSELEQRQQLALAWNTAALSRTKRMPSLRSLLSRRGGPVTDEEMDTLRDKYQALKKSPVKDLLVKQLEERMKRVTRAS